MPTIVDNARKLAGMALARIIGVKAAAIQIFVSFASRAIGPESG